MSSSCLFVSATIMSFHGGALRSVCDCVRCLQVQELLEGFAFITRRLSTSDLPAQTCKNPGSSLVRHPATFSFSPGAILTPLFLSTTFIQDHRLESAFCAAYVLGPSRVVDVYMVVRMPTQDPSHDRWIAYVFGKCTAGVLLSAKWNSESFKSLLFP